MTDTIKISRDTLEDLRDLAFDEAERHRQAMGVYRRDRQARMDATIAKADALLATPPADAADMGGQAGEEVEVVAYIGRESRMTTEGWEDGHEYVVLAEHASDADKRYDVPLMTASQHRRILAQHRQQAGKLVEALRKIHFRADCFVEDDMDMRVPSIKAIVRIAGEALAARDVKP